MTYSPYSREATQLDFLKAELLLWVQKQLYEPIDEKILEKFRHKFKVPRAKLLSNWNLSYPLDSMNFIMFNPKDNRCRFSLVVEGKGVAQIEVHSDGTLRIGREDYE